MSKPYTYLIGWTALQKFYYGVRYAKNCDPSDLWVSYFTSSKKVKEMRLKFGEPNIIKIRKTFISSINAKKWEDKVLRRLDVLHKEKWLNATTNYSFRNIDRSWNEGLTKQTSRSLLKQSQTMQEIRKNKKWKGGYQNRREEDNIKTSWTQIKKSNKDFIFNEYENFVDYCICRHKQGIGPFSIGKELGIDGGTVRSTLERAGIKIIFNSSWTKIKKRFPNFCFNSYEELCDYCYHEINKGRKVHHLKKELKLSECTIKKAYSMINPSL